jgi:hypothetical protein
MIRAGRSARNWRRCFDGIDQKKTPRRNTEAFPIGLHMCGAPTHVRSTPNSDRESGLQQSVMSALPSKADMCSAQAHVCFGPEADVTSRSYNIRSMVLGPSSTAVDRRKQAQQ